MLVERRAREGIFDGSVTVLVRRWRRPQATAGHVFAPAVAFDRPYLMVVTDRATGEPLFMARVADPTGN